MPSALFLALILTIVLWTSVGAKNYRWTAALDRSSGIATSLEVSSAPLSNRPWTKDVCVRTIFATYPVWLVKPSVTGGILKAKSNPNGSTTIHLRGFGHNILTFQRHVARGKDSILLPIAGGVLALPNPNSRTRKYGGAISFSMNKNRILETKIERGYRPSIAGYSPVSRVRALTYRSTQSLFHAYVMWRFHMHCYDAAVAPHPS